MFYKAKKFNQNLCNWDVIESGADMKNFCVGAGACFGDCEE
jgi:hypothetical protein